MSTLDARVDIGHVHLKVADLDRALAFWHGVLGFDVMQRLGDQALAEAVRRVLEAGVQLDGASDHGVSEAIYLCDPDR